MLSKQGLLASHKVGIQEFCEHCVFGNKCKVKFGTSVHLTKGTLGYIQSELWGPTRVPSLGGRSYMLTFIDDFSWKVWIYILKHKDEVFLRLKQWKTMIEKQIAK